MFVWINRCLWCVGYLVWWRGVGNHICCRWIQDETW